MMIARDRIQKLTDTPADYLLNALVKLLADGRPGDARVAVAKAGEELFEPGVDRDLFRAIKRAVEFASAPGPLEVKFLVERDPDGGADTADVLVRLQHAVEVAARVGWEFHIDSSIRHLRAEYAARQAADLGRELAAAGLSPTPERCEHVIRLAREIQDGIGAGGRDGATSLIDIIDRWKSNKAEKILPTGFDPIDRVLGGGLTVGLHGVAARPRVGKSALALQLAAGALLHNPQAKVVWFRGEMTNDLLVSRLLACWAELRKGHIDRIVLQDALDRSPESRSVYLDIIATLGDRLVVVDPPITPSVIERWIDEAKPDLAVIDYLQKIEAGGFKDRRADLDHVVRRIANASTRADIPIILVSAVAKGIDQDAEIGTITKESNQLDFDAHSYWSLWIAGDHKASPRRTLLRCNKARSSGEADRELWFHGRTQFFAPAAAESYEEFQGFPLP